MVDDKSPEVTFNKESFVGRFKCSIFSEYYFIQMFGAGGYGKVYRVQNKVTGETRACKQIKKDKITDMAKLNLEIDIMIKMDHPNVIKLYEVYEDDKYLYLVMEECTGGELFDRIAKRAKEHNNYTENEASFIFKQIMSAVAYCHSQKICHRDLKPENLLFLDKPEDSTLKVIDFGLSKKFTVIGNKLTTPVGSAFYVSPEVLKGNYTENCDIWSCGVILYMLLSGTAPFPGKNDNEVYRRIETMHYDFPDKYWKNISDEAKDLISKMLTLPDLRLTAPEVLDHPWLSSLTRSISEAVLNLNVEALQSYVMAGKFKKAVLTFIATRLKDEDIKYLSEIFTSMDTNKDGTLGFEEFTHGIKTLEDRGVDLNPIELFYSMDTDNSGTVNYTEFLAASIEQKLYLQKDTLREAFKVFDLDGSGKISKSEIIEVLHTDERLSDEIDALIAEFDLNKDGEIDYEEFLSMMTATNLRS